MEILFEINNYLYFMRKKLFKKFFAKRKREEKGIKKISLSYQ